MVSNAKGVKGGADVLPEIPLPSIVYIIVLGSTSNYVVIYSCKRDKIIVMDPAFKDAGL